MVSPRPSPAYEPNPALAALYRRFFDRIQVDDAWVHQVRSVAERGTVVYILRNLNLIDFLALDHLTKKYALPEVGFVNDLGLWVLEPMGRGWLNALRPKSPDAAVEDLRAALEAGRSAALFLKRPPGVMDLAAGATGGRGMREGDELLRKLIDMQRERSTRPILLVPQVFVWTNQPDTRGTHALDFIFGPREWASPMRTLAQLIGNYRHVTLRAGQALDLQEYLVGAEPLSDDAHVRRITYAMLRRLERERRSVTGPATKPPDRIRHEIIRSPKLQQTIREVATKDGVDTREVTARTLQLLRGMQAMPDGTVLGALEVILDGVFHRIYAGVDIDKDGLERLREASKEASVVLLPSHKSHIDYLIVSFALYQANMQMPYIAAGDNLAFFPLGPVFRRAGAFFIRRSFKGDRLYSTVVDSYIRRLIREGFPVEAFIEGGRSRTGKLLPPKFGLLGMLCEAALSLPQRKTVFVPISIGYERIVETGSYEQELSGAEKRKEDASGLLKSTEVLRHRYGRINLQFGQMLMLDDIREDLGLPGGTTPTPSQRRQMIVRLGNRTMDEINRVTAVTPGSLAALALLSHNRRGLPHEELIERCVRLLEVLQELGARTTPAAATSSGALRPEAIREAVQMFVQADLVEAHAPAEVGARSPSRLGAGEGAIYTIADRRRVELDTSKNIILHFFLERALVSTALLAAPGLPGDPGQVHDRVFFLSRLFKQEFRFRADASFDQIFEETLTTMVSAQEVVRGDDGLLHAGRGRFGWTGHQWLVTYASFLRNYLEAYRIAARGLFTLLKGPLNERELVKKALQTGNTMFFTGEIEYREALSQPAIRNAFLSLAELGFVQSVGGKKQLVPAHESEAALHAIEASIAAYLPKEVLR